MFETILRRIRDRDASVQYEVQRMTPNGGWKNFYKEFGVDEKAQTFESPPDCPELDGSTAYPSGRYRCIRRVDGRIRDVEWVIEITPERAI